MELADFLFVFKDHHWNHISQNIASRWTPIGICSPSEADTVSATITGDENQGSSNVQLTEGDSNPFSETFNGNGYKVDNLYINSSEDLRGLFRARNGTITDLGVIDSVNGNRFVVAVCSFNYGLIDSCYNSCTINGNGSYTGGICGSNDSVIERCHNDGDISGEFFVGGLFGGSHYGAAERCYNFGSVTGGSYVGAICGENTTGTNREGAIADCYYLEKSAIDSTSLVQGGIVADR